MSRSGFASNGALKSYGVCRQCGAAAGRTPALRFVCRFAALRQPHPGFMRSEQSLGSARRAGRSSRWFDNSRTRACGALECGDWSPLFPLGRLVGQAAPCRATHCWQCRSFPATQQKTFNAKAQRRKEVLVKPGTGMVDFRRVFAGLQHGGFRRGPLLVECLDRGDAAQVTAETVKARKFLEELTGQKA